ncbi:hypothetical protein U1Q18_036220 [Sarracenia purpurea var. burkii]
MTVAQFTGGTLPGGLTTRSSKWTAINRMTGSFCSGQPRERCNFVALVDRSRSSDGGVFGQCSLSAKRMTVLLARQRKEIFSVVYNQSSSDRGLHSSSYVDDGSTVEENQLMTPMERDFEFTENPSCQPHIQSVKQELITLSLPAIAGQAIEPLAQLMETAYIGRLGSVELASAGVSMSIFNIISKLFNIPLLSVATSFVAEDISKIASRISTSGEGCQWESGNGKPVDGVTPRQQLSSVSTALFLAVVIGIFEALALSLGSGLFLNLMGISPVMDDS